MALSDSDEKKSRGLGSYLLWAFVALILYVLSSGFVVRSTQSRDVVLRFKVYRPLGLAYAYTPLRKALGWYWHFWVPIDNLHGGVIAQ